MSSEKNKAFAPLTLVLASMGLIVIVMTGAATYIGGTKIRPLFGASADALAGGPQITRSDVETPDASTPHAPDAGDAGPPATP